MKVAIAAVSLNFVLNCLLIGPFGYVGLALATALSAWFNAIALGYLLLMNNGLLLMLELRAILPRLVISALMMGGLCYGFQVLTPFPNESLMSNVCGDCGLGAVSLAYVTFARMEVAFRNFRDLQKIKLKERVL